MTNGISENLVIHRRLRFHRHTQNTYGTLPVKFIPARYGDAVMVSPNTGPSAGTKLTTPGGTPASLHMLKITQLDRSAVSLGFHRTELPYK